MKDKTTGNTLPEVNTEVVDDKVAEKLAEVKVETLVTLLSDIRAEALMHTLGDRLNRDIWRNSGPKIRRGAIKKLAYGLGKVGVTTLNEVKAQALVDTGRHTSTSQD